MAEGAADRSGDNTAPVGTDDVSAAPGAAANTDSEGSDPNTAGLPASDTDGGSETNEETGNGVDISVTTQVQGTVSQEAEAPGYPGEGGSPMEDAYAESLRQEQEDRLEYLRQLRQSCVMEFENWNRYFSSQRRSIDYQVIDEEGNVLLNHAGERNIPTDEDYVFKAVMHYDSVGRMDVTQLNGQNTSHLLNLLQSFGEVDPMENYYWERYLYETAYKLENPKNITFAYAMTQDQLAEFGQSRNYNWRSYYDSGAVSMVLTGLLCFVAVMAFLFSCWDVRRAEYSRILRVPLEAVICVGLGGTAFGYSLTSLVAMTNQGSLYDGLIRANFLPKAASIMVTLWNIMWWCVPFAVIYWAVLCVRDVFHIGLKRYIRERTLCGWLWGGCSWCCRRIYAFIGSIDLQDRSDKTIFKIVGVNFIILAVLCSMWFFGVGALVIYTIILFVVLRKYYRDLSDKYRILLKATNQIAEGNLEGVIEEDLGV